MPRRGVACQRRKRYVSLVERKDPLRADPITRLIAARVKKIRNEQRLSGAALSAAVRELGLPGWVDSTVGKLETGRRESVTVREWFALSLALDAPPPWLLVDPSGDAVPVATGVEVDPWSALMWIAGKRPLVDQPGQGWIEAANLLNETYQAAELLKHLEDVRAQVRHWNLVALVKPAEGTDDAEDRALRNAETEKSLLREIAGWLHEVHRLNLTVPKLPEDIVARCQELDIELPGHLNEVPK